MLKILGSVVMVLVFLLSSCKSNTTYVPKPKGFPRIILPKPAYSVITQNHPFEFEMSKFAVMEPDTFALAEPHWVILKYPKLNAIIQLTYKPTYNSLPRLQGIINDAYKLTSKHQVRAYSIDEKIYNAPNGNKATILNLKGDIPSQFQFFTTDTSAHYLRGAIYFKTAQANDSLAPVIDFLKEDCIHLINTLKWKKSKG